MTHVLTTWLTAALFFALGGGRMRTGGIGEYHLSAGVVAVCAGIIFMRGQESGFRTFLRPS